MTSIENDDKSSQTVIIFKKAKVILDNITTENLSLIVSQLKELKINTIEQLSGLIQIVYLNIVENSNKVESYAYVCQHLSTLAVPVLSNHNLVISFKYVLLANLLKELEKDYSSEQEDKMRKNVLAIIRLIIELYKLKIIRASTMHAILNLMFYRSDEISLECVCVILTLSGKVLHLSEKRNRYLNCNLVNSYFCYLQEIAENMPLDQNVQSLLEDIIYLKSKKWDTSRVQAYVLHSDMIKDMIDADDKTQCKKSQEITDEIESLQCPLTHTFSSCGNVDFIQPEKLFKQVKKYLSNLTLENIPPLISYLKESAIDSLDKLLGVISLIYEKAIEDFSSATRCAYICKKISNIQLSLSGNDGNLVVTFRYVLLNKCQTEFEMGCRGTLPHKSFNKGEIQRNIKLGKDVEETEIRRHRLGNIRFLCKLFEMQIIKDFILHDIIKTLLNDIDELSLECLCIVFLITGRALKLSSCGYPLMLKYFDYISDEIKKGHESQRVQSMLKDVIDVMRTNWSCTKVSNTLILNVKREPDAGIQDYDRSAFESISMVQKVEKIMSQLQINSVKNILQQIKKLNIVTKDELQMVADKLYEKAITDADTSAKCAEVCQRLGTYNEFKFSSKTQFILFKNVLLSNCMHEFMKYYTGDLQFKTIFGEMIIETINQRTELKIEEEELRKVLLSNTRFILDLYKVHLVSKSFMHNFIKFLLQSEEILLECVCLVFHTIGKHLDHVALAIKKRCLIDNYFSTLHDMLNNESLTLNIQLMMMEVIDLRHHKWIPKKVRPDCWINNMFWKECELYQKFETSHLSSLSSNSDSCSPSTSSLSTLLKGNQLLTVRIVEKFEEILSKIKTDLSPEMILKFKELETFGITKEERLKFVAMLIYEKAKTSCDEQQLWAKVCKHFCDFLDLDSHQQRFRKCISESYFREMIKICSNEIINTVPSKINGEITKDSEIRREIMGSIKFILELFKLEMISTEVIHRCINLLLQRADEVSMECVCILFIEIGKALEDKTVMGELSLMDNYFSIMCKILHNGLLSKDILLKLEVVINSRYKWLSKKQPRSLLTDICTSNSEEEKVDIVELETGIDNLKSHQFPQSLDIQHMQNVDMETRNLLEKFRKILGEITTENQISEIMSKIKALNLNIKKLLEYLVELIYEKLIHCPNLLSTWVSICYQMFADPQNKNLSGGYSHFVLGVCQRELKMLCSKDVGDRKRLLNIKQIKSDSQRRQSSDSQEVRRQVLANITFIMELFKLKVIKISAVYSVTKLVLHWENEFSVECLCTILIAVGKDLEQEKLIIDDCHLMDHYINSIFEICNKSPVSRRILLMVEKVTYLKHCNWTPEKALSQNVTSDSIYTDEHSGMVKTDGLEPIVLENSMPCHHEDLETRNILQNVLTILKKIKMVDDFSLLVSEFKNLKIVTEERIEYVSILLHETISCPTSAVKCSKLCYQLSTMLHNTPQLFHHLTKCISKLCIQELNKICYRKIKNVEELEKMEYSENPSKQLELRGDIDIVRIQLLGNVIFIVELFFLDIVQQTVISNTIKNLLQTPDQISMECLLYIITKEEEQNLNIKKDRAKDVYFRVVSKLMKKGLNEKIQLLIEDIESVLWFHMWAPK